MKKCLITKKTENLNTSVTVNTEIGKITIWISDDAPDITLNNIKNQVNELISSAKEIADTFNFDLSQAINKGGVMQIGEPDQPSFRQQPVNQQSIRQQPVKQQTSTQKPSFRNQEIPIRNSVQAATRNTKNITINQNRDIQNTNDPYFDDSDITDHNTDIINEQLSNKPLAKESVVVVSPTGNTFELPTKIIDEYGETSITVDPEAANRFNHRLKNMNSSDSFSDYSRVKKCPLCRGTCKIDNNTCPKCKGDGNIYC